MASHQLLSGRWLNKYTNEYKSISQTDTEGSRQLDGSMKTFRKMLIKEQKKFYHNVWDYK